MGIEDLLNKCEEAKNLTMFDGFIKSEPKIETKQKIVCSISGGSDSDIMLDICVKLDNKKRQNMYSLIQALNLKLPKTISIFLKKNMI